MAVKPLSEKALAKKYAEAGWSKDKLAFLHDFFLAGANLYGTCTVQDLWDIYKFLGEHVKLPKLQRKDMVTFSAIARRDRLPYAVYEIDEIYGDEERKETERMIVHKDLVGSGYYRFDDVYRLSDRQLNKPFYVPDDYMSYAEAEPSPEENALRGYLDELQGMTTHSRTAAAEEMFRQLRRAVMTGFPDTSHAIRMLTDQLSGTGTGPDEEETLKLLELVTAYNNSSHLWLNRGWAPQDMRQPAGAAPTLVLSPEIKRMLAENGISEDEFLAMLAGRGINTLKS